MRQTTQLRVRFADTDAAGIVHYAHYLAFFETGRAEALRQLGLPPARIVSCGLHAPIQEAVLRYRAPARFDDLLVVTTWVADVVPGLFKFAYEVVRANDQALIAIGETLHRWSEPPGAGFDALPDWLKAALDQLREKA